MTITDAALASGYSKNNPCRVGSQAIERIRVAAPELLARHGLDDDALIEKHLIPLLNAEETKFFAHEGKVTDQRNVAALGIRDSALDKTLKIRGLYSNPNQDSSSKPTDVRIVVVYETNQNVQIVQKA
jgi:hypothetical protein